MTAADHWSTDATEENKWRIEKTKEWYMSALHMFKIWNWDSPKMVWKNREGNYEKSLTSNQKTLSWHVKKEEKTWHITTIT